MPRRRAPTRSGTCPVIVIRSSKPSGSCASSSALRHGWQCASTTGAADEVDRPCSVPPAIAWRRAPPRRARPRPRPRRGARRRRGRAGTRPSPRAGPSDAASASAASARVSRQARDRPLPVSGRSAGSALTGGGSSSPRSSPSRPAARSAPRARYGFAAPSADFHSTLADAVAARPAGALEPQRRLAVLVAPAGVDAGPAGRLQPVVGERRSARRARVSAGRCASTPARNASPAGRSPSGPLAAGELVHAVAPDAHVDVRAVADRPGDARGARSSPASRPARRPRGRRAWRAPTRRRPAADRRTGSDISIWPFEYSGWICSGTIPELVERVEQVEHQPPGPAERGRPVTRALVQRLERRSGPSSPTIHSSSHAACSSTPRLAARARPCAAGSRAGSPTHGSPDLLVVVERRPAPSPGEQPRTAAASRSARSRTRRSGCTAPGRARTSRRRATSPQTLRPADAALGSARRAGRSGRTSCARSRRCRRARARPRAHPPPAAPRRSCDGIVREGGLPAGEGRELRVVELPRLDVARAPARGPTSASSTSPAPDRQRRRQLDHVASGGRQ